MENSIEEDIKYIEDVIALAIVLPIGEVKIQEEEIEAMQHILSDYKRVLKENEYMHNELDKQQTTINKYAKENEKLKNIRYDTPYGTETIHLIPESNLIEINTQKYMIEVESGKFVDLKQVYLENKKLNECKENYIPIQKIKDKIEYLDNQQKQWIEDRELKESDSEIIFARNFLQELIEEREENNGKNI